MTKTDRQFRFAVTGRGETRKDWCEFARKAEDFGYSTLAIGDHIGRFMAPFQALVVAAQVTTTLRFAVQTLVNDARHPAVVAQEAATADVLTGGRFEIGIGAGSLQRDRQQLGLPADPPRVRVERVAEAVQILKAYLTNDTVNFSGKHYTIEGLPAFPKPLQRPRPPLMIGASAPRMLRLAAEQADIVGILTAESADMISGAMPEKIALVRRIAASRYEAIELHTWFTRVQVDGSPSTITGRDDQRQRGLIGSREEIVERLVANRERYDVSYITISGSALEAFAPVVARLAGT
jgi:probable F420-dependent oxidoreductase